MVESVLAGELPGAMSKELTGYTQPVEVVVSHPNEAHPALVRRLHEWRPWGGSGNVF